MKIKILTLCFFIFQSFISMAQDVHLEVEGHSKIRGNLDISHKDDTTSIIIGRQAGLSIDPTLILKNTIVGVRAGLQTNTGADNSFFGYGAGKKNMGGSQNSFFGKGAGEVNSGDQNSFFGALAGSHNSTGENNSFFGRDAGIDNVDGSSNSFVGSKAGQGNLGGSSNSFFGRDAGGENRNGNNNTYIGRKAGQESYEGSNNTFVGYGTTISNVGDTIDNAIAIGYLATVECDNCAVIGGKGVNAVNLGIGIEKPTSVLMLQAKDGNNPIGITQNQVGAGSSMEFTTQDGGGLQATRFMLKGSTDNVDAVFYRGPNGSESASLFIEGSNGNVGIDNVIPTHKLDVNGNARIRSVSSGAFNASLNITANGTLTTSTSDRRLKENISAIEESLDKVMNLRGVTFNWKADEAKELRLGVIAQEVEAVVPELVFTNQVDGYKGVRYEEVSALLIEAIKMQQLKLEQQEGIIERLQKEMEQVHSVLKTLEHSNYHGQ